MAALNLHKERRAGELLVEIIVRLVALASIASVFLILLFVGRESLPLVTDLFGTAWQPASEPPRFGILPLFAGTLKVTLIALLVAVPLSVAAAIYVSEVAGRRLREIIKPAIELLAGVPSVVIGFFALVVLAGPVQKLFGTEHRLNALVAGIALSFTVCPLIFSVSEDALRAVPGSYRTAALALGSTRTQSLFRVVLPAAAPGIAAAVLLGLGRAIGETMIVVLASGNAALVGFDFGRSTRTVTATIAQELGEVVVGSVHYHVLFLLGALLFVSALLVNLVGERIIDRMRKRQRGGA